MAARAALAAVARGASSHCGIFSSPAKLIPRRGLAGVGDHHGPTKVNCWQDPLSPSRWKEEHFVIVSLAGWGLLIYGGYKAFTGGKKDKKAEAVAGSPL